MLGGTVENPWIIHVDTHHPERNREFDINYVRGKVHAMHKLNVYHIRIRIAIQDRHLWSAYIPHELPDEMDSALGHCLMIKGPLRPHCFRDAEAYHCKDVCKATFETHTASQLEIKRSIGQRCAIVYWLLVFPDGVEIDNTIISGDRKAVIGTIRGMKELVETKKGPKEVLEQAICWEVAEKGGQRIQKVTKVIKDLDNLYN